MTELRLSGHPPDVCAPVVHTVSAPPTFPWRRALLRVIVAVDAMLLVLVNSVVVAVGVHDTSRLWDPWHAVSFSTVAVLVAIMAMALVRCWEPRILGQGTEEFGRIMKAFALGTLALAAAGMFFQSAAVRPWVFGVLPLMGLGVAAGRVGVRVGLHQLRRRGRCRTLVLLVGDRRAVTDLAERAGRAPHHGWSVVGACTTDDLVEPLSSGHPVHGRLEDVTTQVAVHRVDLVAVALLPQWGPEGLRALAWRLEGTGVELMVDPGLMEIGSPRLHIAPVDGLPLLRLTEPRLTGPARVVKAATDRALALALVVVLAPLLLWIAAAVGRDGGAVFYRQERIGRGGRPFLMLKFRSMVVDADRHTGVLARAHDGSGPLFKLRDDPRITSTGRLLRRYSLDELPQLLNVIAGSMSLVGPRPPLPREVDTYADDARRRLLVKPGMTGLWQVSGRSDLSWEESVRLDLRYVENWSPALDLAISCRTVGAVLRGRGAY